MKTDKIKILLEKNQERKNLHWKIKNNTLMFEHNGYWYDQSFLDIMFPVYELCKYLDKGENKDSKSLS